MICPYKGNLAETNGMVTGRGWHEGMIANSQRERVSAGEDSDEDDEGYVGEQRDGRHDATTEPPGSCV